MVSPDKHSAPLRVHNEGSLSGTNYCVVELLSNSLVLRGECWFSVLSGWVQVFGATLTPDHDVVHLRSMSTSADGFVVRKAEPFLTELRLPGRKGRRYSSPDKDAHNNVRGQLRNQPWAAQSTMVLVTTAHDTDTRTLKQHTPTMTDGDAETVLLKIGGDATLFAREADNFNHCDDQSGNSSSYAAFVDPKSRGCKRRVLLCGQANTSQAFDQVLNQILSHETQVVALDADISQSDFHPVGVISACVLQSYKLSNYIFDSSEIEARFFGHTTTNRNPALFFHQLTSLIMVARESCWLLDAPLVLRVTINKATRGYFERICKAVDVSCVIMVGDQDWYEPGAGIQVFSFLDFHPELTTNYRTVRTDENRSSLSTYFVRPTRKDPEIHQMLITEVPIWNSQSQVVHPIETGTFLVFCAECSFDTETQPIEQNWLGFGLVCGTDLEGNFAEVLSPLKRDLLMSSECFLVNEDFTQEDGSQMFADKVSESIFYLPGAISGARGMKSRRNLLRYPAS